MSLEQLLLPLEQLELEAVDLAGPTITIVTSSNRAGAVCPACHTASERVHSGYIRTVADLPWADRRLVLRMQVRRFFCPLALCPKRTFAERFGASIPPFARRTTRLTDALRALAFTAGGQGSARLAQLLAMPLSPRTALRLLHAHPLPSLPPPHVVGLDDWVRPVPSKQASAWG